MFTTRIDKHLLKSLKLLSVIEDKPINTLLEEAIQNLLIEYEKKDKPTTQYRIVYTEEKTPPESDTTKKKRSDK